MSDDNLVKRFPDGYAMLRAALRREGIKLDLVSIELQYFSWAWALEVSCPTAGYRRVQQLPPEDLRADTAFRELCDSIAEELAEKLQASAY